MQRQHVSTKSSNMRERHDVSIPLPEIHSVRSERYSSSIRKSRIDRRWKRLVKFLERCSEMLWNWYTSSRRATKLRDAVLHSEATCPKVKSTIETDSNDISVVAAHTLFASRVRILISVLYNLQQSHVARKERRA